jgi:DNA-binding NtrC family response regulator/pSer/pThr/pTyr-binding forkhead associated (FHA) protein
MSEQAPATCWRLRGVVDDVETTAILGPGLTLVGSSRDADVVLAMRGVSRRHAQLTLGEDEGAVEVRDLGSKNGTWVAGERIASCTVTEATDIRFGPVHFVLETIPSGDAELGLELSDEEGEERFRATPGVTTHASTASAGAATDARTAQLWLRLVATAADRLTTSPPSDVDGVLELVRRELHLEGAALSEARPGEQAVLLAAAGQLGELPHAVTRPGDRGATAHVVGGDNASPFTSAVRMQTDGTVVALTLWGDFAGRAASQPLLSSLLALALAGRSEPLALLDERPAERQRLRFPDGYVPGESSSMRALFRLMESLAGSDLPALVVGETGVGKEPIARTVHASSARASGPFVAVNCAAIPADLLEAEMFGIGRGVATGVEERRGRFLEASGGTLFLDEIADMPMPLQAKLLRALEEGEIHPVGRPPLAIDVRIVAASNRDLRAEAEAGRFRRDLYYRIAGSVLAVPPLRERREDVPGLVGHFLRREMRAAEKRIRGLTVKTLEHLTSYRWPGNVRELEHEVRRLVHLVPGGGVVDSGMLSSHVLIPAEEPEGTATGADDTLELAAHTAALRRRLITTALARTDGNRSEAARLLGVSRNSLAQWIRELGIEG